MLCTDDTVLIDGYKKELEGMIDSVVKEVEKSQTLDEHKTEPRIDIWLLHYGNKDVM